MSHQQIVIYDGGDGYCFVPLPLERGRYIRTHYCVAYVACTYPTCLSEVGEPCKGSNGKHKAETHVVRRDAYRKFKERSGTPSASES